MATNRMDARGVFVHCVNASGKSRKQLSKDLNRTQNYITKVLHRGSIPQVDTFSRIADACGYDLLVRNRESSEEIIIDPPE